VDLLTNVSCAALALLGQSTQNSSTMTLFAMALADNVLVGIRSLSTWCGMVLTASTALGGLGGQPDLRTFPSAVPVVFSMHACEMHAYEMHVYEIHAYEVHARERGPRERHAHEMHARERHAHKMHASEMHAHERAMPIRCRPVEMHDRETLP
jgi:hypothetical protein